MQKAKVVLVNLGQRFDTDAIRDNYYHFITDYIRDAGLEITLVNGNEYDKELTVRQLADADGVIFSSNGPMTREVMEQLPRLKYIMRYGIGVDSVDLKAATDLGKIVCNTPGYCSDVIGVHATALCLSSLRNIPYYDRNTKEGIWLKGNGPLPMHPCNMTVGFFGLGRSAYVAAKAFGQGFGSKLIAYDPYADPEQIKALNVEMVSFDELLARSDALFVMAPLTEQTRHAFDDAAFDKMKRSAILVNVSRGGIVDGKALSRALEQGKIAKAALDVFEVEPPAADDPLLKLDHVITTPHSAYYGQESLDRANFLISRITAHVFTDHKLYKRHVVNPDVVAKLEGYTFVDEPVEDL